MQGGSSARGDQSSWTPLSGAGLAVALEVLRHGPLPRSELARRLELSPQSLTRLAKPLLDANLLVETAPSAEGLAGRPTRPLDVVPGSHHFIGVKLTHDTAYAVATTMRAQVVESRELRLSSTAPEAVVEAVRRLVADLTDTTGEVSALGVSLGGQVERGRTVTQAPFLAWREVELADLLEGATGLATVVDNDLLSLTRAEQWFGAARDCDHFAVVTVGEGVGYGLVVHDRVVASPDAGLGLVGHFPLDPTGPLCATGQHRGCASSMLTVRGITAQVGIALGRPVGFAECLELATGGDPAARAVVDSAARGLGRLVAAVANLAMPQRILIAGEAVGVVDVARTEMDDAIAQDRDPAAAPLDIEVQHVGFAEWARGAAATAIQAFVLGDAER